MAALDAIVADPPVTAPAAPERHRAARPHLHAAILALLLLVVAATVACFWGEVSERTSFAKLRPIFADPNEHDDGDPGSVSYLEHLKNQGFALQRRAFERSDTLPLYGSSELIKRIPDKASLFYRDSPSGFYVFPVGKAGTNTLIMLQKLASLGDVTYGERVAISLSPSWFLAMAPSERPYLGNFSPQQSLAALLNTRLSFGLKRDLSRAILEHPLSLHKDALVRFIVKGMARGGLEAHAVYAVAWPLAKLHLALNRAQDHFEIAGHVRMLPPGPPPAPAPPPRELDWDSLIAEAAARPNPTALKATQVRPFQRAASNEVFRERLVKAPEWDHLELLLRGLHELGLVPLVLCMPPNGVYYENTGISKESIELFAERLRGIVEHSGAVVELFEDHQEDYNFLVDHQDHMSAKGWMYFNRALDEFYHTDRAELERTFAKGHRKHVRLPAALGRL